MRPEAADPHLVGKAPRVPVELTRRPFSLAEARAAGISLSALRGKAWERVGSKLYRWKGARLDPWGLLDACRQTLPSSAVFIERTAAWMHGLDVEPIAPIQVAVPPDTRVGSRAAVEIRHCLLGHDVVAIRGFRATSIHRTLLDHCVRSRAVEALVVIDMALKARLTDKRRLKTYARRAPGAARLRRLAEIAAPAESPMETRLRWLLLEARLPGPEVQRDLYDDAGSFVGRADLYYPSDHLVIEFDGGNHRDRLVSDDRRQNLLVDAGYRVLRFTTADVTQRPAGVIALVTSALRASPRPR